MEDNSHITTCPNCDYQFSSNFCPNCGQSAKDLNRPFREIAKDTLDGFFSFFSFHIVIFAGN